MNNLMKETASGNLIQTLLHLRQCNRRSQQLIMALARSTKRDDAHLMITRNRLLKAVDTLYPTPITRQYGTSNTSLASGLDFMSQEVTPQGTVNYVPDSAGRRSQMSWTNGQASRIVNYGYDNADNLKTVTPQGAAGSVIGYDNDSRRQTVTLPNGLVVTYGYDPDSNVNSITYKNGATTLGTLTYGYDADDRKISVGGTYARTNLPTTAQTFSYYPDNSLQKLGALTVQNDNDGNITCMVSSPCPQFSYDVRGHLQQVQVLPSVFVDYSYDTFGRRYQVTAVAGSTTTNQYDGFNILDTWPQALESYAGMNLAGLGLDDFFGVSNSSGSVNESFLRDALNSTIAITDASGNILDQTTYDAYGNTTDSVPTQASVFEFTGRENDGDGLYYMRSRYYAPSIARFISRDPIGIAGGLNTYEYAGDSPTNATDPTGNYLVPAPGAGCGGDCWGFVPVVSPFAGTGPAYGVGPGAYVGPGLGLLVNQGGLDHDVIPMYHGQNHGGLQLAKYLILTFLPIPRNHSTPGKDGSRDRKEISPIQVYARGFTQIPLKKILKARILIGTLRVPRRQD